MIALRTADLKADISGYFKKAFDGEKIVITRPRKENVAIISEERLRHLEELEQKALYIAKLERRLKNIEEGKFEERELLEV